MGTNGLPLAALYVHPPAPQDPGETIQRALTLRALMNQAQYQQQLQPLQIQEAQQRAQQQTLQTQALQKQVDDQRTIATTAPQFTIKDDSGKPTGFDEEGFANALQGKGVNPLTINAWRTNNAETKQKLAAADKSVRENADAINNEAYNHLEGVRSTTDPDSRQQAWQAGHDWAQKHGIDTSKWSPNAPDDNGLNLIEASLGMHAQQVADAGKQAEILKNRSAAGEQQAKTTSSQLSLVGQMLGNSKSQNEWDANKQALLNRGVPQDLINNLPQQWSPQASMNARNLGVTPEKQVGLPDAQQYVQNYLAAHKLDDTPENRLTAHADYIQKTKVVPQVTIQNAQNAGLAGTNGQPSVMAQMIANGQMQWHDAISNRTPINARIELANEIKKINPNWSSGDFDVEQGVRKMATSGTVGQQLLAIGTAREHMKLFGQLSDALDNNNWQLANKIGNYFGVQFGSDKATNLKIAAQAFGGEVGRAFDGAGVTAGEREEASKAYADYLGKGQFKGAIKTVDSLLEGKQKAAHDWFDKGSHGTPDFGESGTRGNAVMMKAPDGTTKPVPADQVKHFQDLGAQVVNQ